MEMQVIIGASIIGCIVAFTGEYIAIHVGTYIRNVKARKRY